ncbi:MAG: aldehyde dehydrogenase family protein, partial [Pseudomonadota bacterium]|nr:aldehyde dehydrogenase family protein [Pseudomonadota bacterium]
AFRAGKRLNAGQICWAPDDVFVPRDRVGEFVESSKRSVAKMYTTLLDNPDYTSVINARHFERINGYVDEARERGVEVVEINPADEDFRQQSAHKIAPTLLIDPPEDSAVMQEEIFGPVMPIKSYDSLDETLDYVNSHDRPLGLYYFGTDQEETQRVLNQTTSGGVTLNDVVMHVAQEDLPFGGVGPSGMGAYHGEDGFRTFSHAKAVFKQATFNPAEKLGLRPPYGDKLMGLLKTQIK